VVVFDPLRVLRVDAERVGAFGRDRPFRSKRPFRVSESYGIVRESIFQEIGGDLLRIGYANRLDEGFVRLRYGEIPIGLRKLRINQRFIFLGVEANFLHSLKRSLIGGRRGLRDEDRTPGS
jgi:hypothetical protein